MKFQDTLENCRFCLMCRHVAPVGEITAQEALTPHGVALTITSQERGLISWNEETAGIVYSEVDGGNSRAHCVNSLPFEEAVSVVRANLAAQDLAPAAVYETRDKLAQWGTPFGQEKPATSSRGKTALFVGDEGHYLWPDAVPAALKLLQHTGLEAGTIGAGRNNGFLAQSLGFPDLAAQLAHTVRDEISGAGIEQLFVMGPGDYFVFNQAHEERLGIPWDAEVALVEVTVYLAQQLAEGKLTLGRSADDTPYAYIDPTHAVRVPGRHDAARQLLAQVMRTPPLELFWRRDRAHPLGSTHLQFSDPSLAERLTRTRLEDARNSGARLIISDDPATLHHLQSLAGEYDLNVRGLYELLAEQIS